MQHDPLDAPGGHATIQRELSGLEKWTDGNIEKFKKCKALHLDHLHAYIYAGRHLAGKHLCRKASEVLEDHDYIGCRRL